MTRWILFSACAVVSLVADQVTKAWARAVLKPLWPRGITVVRDFFDLRYSENTGSAFGLLRDQPWARPALVGAGVVALGFIVSYLRKLEAGQRRLAAALGLIGGGAVGNIVDRIAFGRVTDFVVWHYHEIAWPTFNVADAALVAGVGLMLLDLLPGEAARTARARDGR